MTGRVSRHGWIVLQSIGSPDSGSCVDLFQRPTVDEGSGTFGFELFRSDPEDQGRWTAVGGFAGVSYETVDDARSAAIDAVAWLNETS